MAETAQNEPWLSSALRALDRVVGDVVARGVPTEQIVLLGFSQGACLMSEFAAAHAARYGGVIIFSGGLIGPPGTTWNYGGSFDGTPVFLGNSDVDAHVPQARVEESAAVFTRMGAVVDLRAYPGMAHIVNDDEISAARGMLDAVARARADR
jgi:predicted esterase